MLISLIGLIEVEKLENELELIVFPETEPKKFSVTWDDIAKTIYANEKFKNENTSRCHIYFSNFIVSN